MTRVKRSQVNLKGDQTSKIDITDIKSSLLHRFHGFARNAIEKLSSSTMISEHLNYMTL